MHAAMENISTTIWRRKLFILIDLDKNLGPSKSGKTTNVALSRGYRRLPVDSRFGLNLHLYRLPQSGESCSMAETGCETASSTQNPEVIQLVAIASGLSNPEREELVDQVKAMIKRDSQL